MKDASTTADSTYPELNGYTEKERRDFIQECRQRREVRVFLVGLLGITPGIALLAYLFLCFNTVLDMVDEAGWSVRIALCLAVLFCVGVFVGARAWNVDQIVRSDLARGLRPQRSGTSNRNRPAEFELEEVPSRGNMLFLSGFRAFPELDGYSKEECRELFDSATKRFPASYRASVATRIGLGALAFLAWYAVGFACCAGALNLFDRSQPLMVGITIIVYPLGGFFVLWCVLSMVRHSWFSSVLPAMLDPSKCTNCGYTISGLRHDGVPPTCPECGTTARA